MAGRRGLDVLRYAGVESQGQAATRLREDGDSLVIRFVGPDEREMLIEAEPDLFYFTDHYRNYPMVLMRLSAAEPKAVEALLLRGWKELAGKRLREAFEKG